MNFYAISALINLVTSLILGGFAFIKNPKKAINISFFLLTISISVWSVAYFVWQISDTYNAALFWTRMLSVGSTLIPILYLQWILLILGLLKDKKRLAILIFGYLGTAVFLYFSFSSLFVKDVVPALNFLFWPKAGFLYTIYLLFSYVGLIGYGLIELIRAYYKRKGIIRYQIKYIILATIISFVSGATNFFLWYNIPIPPVGNILVALYTIILFYAMARYRLMDIRTVFQKFIIFVGTSGIVYGSYYLITWFYNNFLGGIYTIKTYLIGLIIAPLFVGVFFLLTKFIKIFANKYLFFSLYNYQETITKLADELSDSIDLDKIVNSIVDTIKETMNLNRAGVLLINKEKGKIHYKVAKVIGFNETNGISLVQDSFLTRYLGKTKKVLIREELHILSKESKNKTDKKNFEKLAKNMEKIEASLCLPLISGFNLIGIIVLGSKNSGDAYTKEDLDLLGILSKQAAVAVENAMLYKQVQKFSKTLQQKVAEQTKKIRDQKEKIEEAYKIEKQAHEELKKLDEAKTQFSLAAQHHLRTPLTSMCGYLDLLLGGSYGKISKKVKDILNKFSDSTQNEIKIVNELLDISQFQMGKEVVFIKDDVKMGEIIKEAVQDVRLEAKNKGIYVKTDVPQNLPIIKADLKKLKMAVCNIIDNAVKYTKKGGVDVAVEIKDNNLLITVKDTGVGIAKEHQKGLFDKLFERSKEAEKMFATGRGIGLWITYRIIQGHQGRIWLESDGLGKGSTFFIELPITN